MGQGMISEGEGLITDHEQNTTLLLKERTQIYEWTLFNFLSSEIYTNNAVGMGLKSVIDGFKKSK